LPRSEKKTQRIDRVRVRAIRVGKTRRRPLQETYNAQRSTFNVQRKFRLGAIGLVGDCNSPLLEGTLQKRQYIFPQSEIRDPKSLSEAPLQLR
jgi:hypothetical protein